ncbi:ATP-grasp domain-containing protein [bacterium]|nr:ATP-grasp domain-containing protein [bacterium]
MIHIAVTGINPTDNPGPGSGVIRSIRMASKDVHIIGLAYDTMDPGIFVPELVDVAYMIPYPSQDPSVLMERILKIHKKERIDVLIPTLDAELLNFIQLENELKKEGIKLYLPSKEQFEMRSKNILSQFCEKHGIAAPKTEVLYSIDQLYKGNWNYPIYIKGIFYDAYMAHSLGDAASYFHKIQAKWGVPIIVQEFIPGEEFDVVALGDGTGETVGAVAMKKMSLTDKGKAWAGVSVYNEALLDITHKLIRAIKWKGPMEVEVMYHSHKKEFYLIEINPRFPAWCYLSAGVDVNLPWSLIELAQEKRVELAQKYKSGTLFVRYSTEVIADVDDIEKLVTLGYLKK